MATRCEYAYEPKSKGGTFTQVLFDQANKQGQADISLKNHWKEICALK